MTSKFRNNYLPELFALGIKRKKPAVVTVNLTNCCNQHCIYCEIGCDIPSVSNGTLTYEDLVWIVDQAAQTGIKRMALCGGEPFLFDGLVKLVAYAAQKNIRCAITTNGMTAHLLSEEELRILKDSRAEINISIDSFQEEIQSVTRGVKGSIPSAVKSAQRLIVSGIPVTMLTVISTYNCHQLSDTFRSAWELGIKQVLFQPVIYYSNFPDRPAIADKPLFNVSPDQLDILMTEFRKVLHLERMHKIKTNVYRIMPWIRQYLETAASPEKKWFFKDVLDDFYCREIDAIVNINYDGSIQPCGLSKASLTIHENREAGLMALWSAATAELKEDMDQGRYHDYCDGCCHHFSTNMLASVIKHPIRNRKALFKVLPFMISRVYWTVYKFGSF